MRYIGDFKNLILICYDKIEDAPLSNLLRQDIIKTENQLMVFYDSIWQYFPDTGRSKGAYIVFYQGGTIDNYTHVTGTVSQSSATCEYNESCNPGMALEHFRMINNEFLDKDPNVVPEQVYLIILDGKSAMCIAKNGKGNKHTR